MIAKQISFSASTPELSAANEQMQLAQLFSADMEIGLKLQATVGPWIAHLGSGASKPESRSYNINRRTGASVVRKLKLPLATGGALGSMEGANLGAYEAGGLSVGIYLEGLPSEQLQNIYCTHSIRCKTLLARQHLLLSGACGLIVGPEGGWGTIFEIGHQLIEMRRKSFDPSCPIAIIDEDELWEGFRLWMEKELVGRGLWKNSEYEKIKFVHSEEEATDHLLANLPKHLLTR